MPAQQSINGQIYMCSSCSKIHLEFLSTGIDFESEKVLYDFYTFLEQIDARFYELKNIHLEYRRKVIIPFPQTAIKMLLTAEEVDDLRRLIYNYLNKRKNPEDFTGAIGIKMGPGLKKVQLN